MGGGGTTTSLANKNNNDIIRIVLTGGPCAGKTTSLALVKKFLEKEGFQVCTVPETSTLILSNGASYPSNDNVEDLLTFEQIFINLHLTIEQSFINMLKLSDKPKVLIYDRAIMDIKAYLPDEIWSKTLSNFNMTEESILKKYDLVLHLVTAANGAEGFYGRGTNAIRYEGIDDARKVDQKLYSAWEQHSNHHRIINRDTVECGFTAKMEDIYKTLNDFLGKK